MSPFSLRKSTLPRLLLPLLAGMFALALSRTAPQAADGKPVTTHAYIMANDEGYGLTECMALGGACARIVADAWCEAHGHGQAISFGPAEDVTASIGDAKAQSLDKGSFLISCAE